VPEGGLGAGAAGSVPGRRARCRGGWLSAGAAGSVPGRRAWCRGGGLGAGAAGSVQRGAAGSVPGRLAPCRGGGLGALSCGLSVGAALSLPADLRARCRGGGLIAVPGLARFLPVQNRLTSQGTKYANLMQSGGASDSNFRWRLAGGYPICLRANTISGLYIPTEIITPFNSLWRTFSLLSHFINDAHHSASSPRLRTTSSPRRARTSAGGSRSLAS
jgi:hypothetical protein